MGSVRSLTNKTNFNIHSAATVLNRQKRKEWYLLRPFLMTSYNQLSSQPYRSKNSGSAVSGTNISILEQ